jgi:hypothetical protein
MAESKDELIAEIDRARARISREMGSLRRDANVTAHLKHSFTANKAAWIGGAGVAGWILSRIPARKKNVYVGKKDHSPVKEATELGLWFGIIKLLLTVFRPVITEFATRKITDFTSRNEMPKK